MAARKDLDAHFRCPFFRWQSRQRISCEGLTDDSSIWQQFATPEACRQHEQIFCWARWQNCEIARAVMAAKYQDD